MLVQTLLQSLFLLLLLLLLWFLLLLLIVVLLLQLLLPLHVMLVVFVFFFVIHNADASSTDIDPHASGRSPQTSRICSGAYVATDVYICVQTNHPTFTHTTAPSRCA